MSFKGKTNKAKVIFVSFFLCRDWSPKFAIGLKCLNRHRSKSIWVAILFFCQDDSLMGGSLWQKNIAIMMSEFWPTTKNVQKKMLFLAPIRETELSYDILFKFSVGPFEFIEVANYFEYLVLGKLLTIRESYLSFIYYERF